MDGSVRHAQCAEPRATLVIPCFNEAARLQPRAFERFVEQARDVRFLFVDDGSTDATSAILKRLCQSQPGRFELLALRQNYGQGEAVRAGIRRAIERGDDYIGYWDADLAASLDEIPRFVRLLDEQPACLCVLGTRRRVHGNHVQRHPVRYLLGRLFAHVASFVLGIRVYDTQCGAKLFRRSSDVEAIFATPFISRWIFDVELLARLIQRRGSAEAARAALRELPLQAWRDVAGSKLRALDFARAPLEMARIGVELHRELPQKLERV